MDAIERFCRWMREPISGERVPVKSKLEMSREMTEEDEDEDDDDEQVMNSPVSEILEAQGRAYIVGS